ncbi:MAG TPA: tetratricopeptide repeat protein, partial [Candidatus Rifleibacterium sp.]|nr:tetratricopeptide repeat protein [Candidatus Rifleibacterium sp.]
ELKKQINPEVCRAITGASVGRLPGNWAALHRLGMHNRSMPAEARSAFERSLAINPYNIDALNNLGLLHLSSGRQNEAESCFRRALELAPDFARAHFNLGLLHAEKKSDSTAANHYRKAAQ